ncbi:hypothetical protein C6P44_004030 [Monosporozyma unispora]|nr:hypothetical protein C6P44_004030 [Kazachstania unispora]
MFKKKNAQKFVVVHRDHDDPDYYNDDENGHVFLPVDDLNKKHQKNRPVSGKNDKNVLSDKRNKATTESDKPALYGIGFDTSKYDYAQHLKPMGQSPNAVFVPAKFGRNNQNNKSYLRHQQNIEDSISGFKPDLNPDLREVLEALEDEAYVVNEDIEVVKPSKKVKEVKEAKHEGLDDEDDIFAELLEGGEVDEDDNAYLYDDHDNLYREDEWDIEAEMNNYEDEHYLEENDNILGQVNKLADLHQIDYQNDVMRFQDEQKKQKNKDYIESDNEFLSEDEENLDEEENDTLGDLPTINNNKKSAAKNSKNKRKQRHKKGAMSDVSGFSMSSSAIARTETMTVLDDSYDNIIGGYENYQEEQEEDEEDYKPFNMAEERSDFESMLDDFLDNYELESGGRKLVKKDPELQKYKDAADKVTKGKLSMRRNREKQKKQTNEDVNNISNSLSSLKF